MLRDTVSSFSPNTYSHVLSCFVGVTESFITQNVEVTTGVLLYSGPYFHNQRRSLQEGVGELRLKTGVEIQGDVEPQCQSDTCAVTTEGLRLKKLQMQSS